ncbi:hypothetical protein RIR_jg26996.t1 [Rhizophagus irregularis DAOM 181602=DAOM 197198]|nr:hypothetical protein RIR_jg26996.t1 [Rhizophagus irregularis DAOM 181602=DAOM 197198]
MNKLRKAHVDRRKLIRCMRIVSQNFWLNIESWHNKFISEDNVNRIKNLLRIMVHIYGFKLALMVYDEEYFPFAIEVSNILTLKQSRMCKLKKLRE